MTIYRPSSIEPIESAGTGSFVIVGGNPGAVIDDDPDSYVDWTWNATTGTKQLKFHFTGVDWPAEGFVNACFKGFSLDGAGPMGSRWTADPYPPNAGYNIDTSYGSGVGVYRSDLALNLSMAGASGLQTDERINDGEGGYYGFSRPFSYHTGWSAGSGSAYILLHLAFWPGSAQFQFRISEVWLEVVGSEPGPGGNETGGPPGRILMATTGFAGGNVYTLGTENTATNRYGEVESYVGNNTSNGTTPQQELIWADGTRVGYHYNEFLAASYKDERGASYVQLIDFPGNLIMYNTGFGLLPDRAGKRGILLFDYDGNWLNSPVDEWQLWRGYVSKTGQVSGLEAIYTVPWASTGADTEWYLPETGGVYNGVATYLSAGTGPASDYLQFWGSTLVELDLNTNDITILGQDDEYFTQTGKPFDWLWTQTATGLAGDEYVYVRSMCIDPSDGTYWFYCLISNGLEFATDYWSGPQLIVHAERDGSLIERYICCYGRYGNGQIEDGGIAVADDGRVYFWASLDIEVIPGNYAGDYDEFDAVWVFDPADAVADSVMTVNGQPVKRVDMSARDNIYFSTGIWAIETDLQVPIPTGVAPLRMSQRDDGLGPINRHPRMNTPGTRNRPTSYQASGRIVNGTRSGYK